MRHWRIAYKEAGQTCLRFTSYSGDVDESFVIDFFGLNKPDIESFYLVEVVKCSICGREIPLKHSNNAEPVNSGRCCNECNFKVVIPRRMRL